MVCVISYSLLCLNTNHSFSCIHQMITTQRSQRKKIVTMMLCQVMSQVIWKMTVQIAQRWIPILGTHLLHFASKWQDGGGTTSPSCCLTMSGLHICFVLIPLSLSMPRRTEIPRMMRLWSPDRKTVCSKYWGRWFQEDVNVCQAAW